MCICVYMCVCMGENVSVCVLPPLSKPPGLKLIKAVGLDRRPGGSAALHRPL